MIKIPYFVKNVNQTIIYKMNLVWKENILISIVKFIKKNKINVNYVLMDIFGILN